MVKWWLFSGIPLPMGVASKPEIACVSAYDCFGNNAEKHTQALGSQEKNQTKCEAPACFHVSQAKWKSPACLLELIRTHLKQMELPDSNGYLLFFYIRARWFVRKVYGQVKVNLRGIHDRHHKNAVAIDAESWGQTRATIKWWFKIHGWMKTFRNLLLLFKEDYFLSNVPQMWRLYCTKDSPKKTTISLSYF